jgi:hypothetical protein
MITFQLKVSGFYINSNQGERELITGETEREHIKVSISTKFRKVVQENRVGVSQDKTFVVDNSLVNNISCGSGLKHVIYRSHHTNVLFVYHDMKVLHFT